MNNDLLSPSAQYSEVVPRFRDFNVRNDNCDECPFYNEECSGEYGKRCFCDDILELLERGWENEHE